MNTLLGWASRNVRFVLSALILLVFTGLGAWRSIPKESNPDINIPNIYVSMSLEGVSPEDAERLLLRPMEQELRTVEGIKEMTSQSYQGGGSVALEFDAGFDADTALQDVREKVDRAKAELPVEADEPTVNEVNFSLFPVITVNLYGNIDNRPLYAVARKLRDSIEGLPQVLSAEIVGLREEQVEIEIDPALIQNYNLQAADVIAFFNRSNRLVAAGNLENAQGKFAVKVPGLFENISDILDMPLKVSGDSAITVRDVAKLRSTYKDPTSFARINGRPSVALQVTKRTGQNVIDTVEAVKKIVAEEQQLWPAGIQVALTGDTSGEIRTQLADLTNNLASAVLLMMILCIATMGVRSGLLAGVAIPTSFLAGILFLSIAGYSLNVVVLFALILVVGNVVDAGIVVIEYADRKMVEGVDRKQAYTEAASRMFLPVLSSILTNICAFLPLLFWPGVVGEFMKFMPITIIATMSASLLIGMFFIPVLGSLFGKKGEADADAMAEMESEGEMDIGKFKGLMGIYARSLSFALHHAGKIVIVAFVVLIATMLAYGKYGAGVEFFPKIEPEQLLVNIRARGNLSIYEQDAIIKQAENRIIGMAGIEAVQTTTGLSRDGQNQLPEDTIGTITLELYDWDTRDKASVIQQRLRERLSDLAGVQIEVREPENGPPTGKAVQIQLTSRYPDALEPELRKIRKIFDETKGLVDITDTRSVQGIEWKLELNRPQAAKFGLDVSAIGDTVRLLTNGLKVASWRPDGSDDEVDIVVRYPADLRTLSALDDLRVQTPTGAMALSNFVTRVPVKSVGTIQRTEEKRQLTILADVAPGILPATIVAEMTEKLKKINLDPRVTLKFKGQDEEQAESAKFLSQAFLGAMFLIAVILLAQFNSFYSVLLILSAVLMSTIGVLIGLLVLQRPFGIVMTGVGVIALAGTIVTNNIVLIDTYDHLKHHYKDAYQAILRTGVQRLRPVFLTAFTNVLGLLPMVFRTNIDFVTREVSIGAPSTAWWVDIAIAIVFGMSFATTLTLIITPCLLMLGARCKIWWHNLKFSSKGAPA